MGSGTGSWSVREAGFRPKLFIGVGNTATLGEHGPPALLLFGRFEEFGIPAQTNAQVVISPCHCRVRCCWQTRARCSDRVAVAIRRTCAGNCGRVGPDVSPV